MYSYEGFFRADCSKVDLPGVEPEHNGLTQFGRVRFGMNEKVCNLNGWLSMIFRIRCRYVKKSKDWLRDPSLQVTMQDQATYPSTF